eukprot:410129-Pelagomonas_calceolata.AAC.2
MHRHHFVFPCQWTIGRFETFYQAFFRMVVVGFRTIAALSRHVLLQLSCPRKQVQLCNPSLPLSAFQ